MPACEHKHLGSDGRPDPDTDEIEQRQMVAELAALVRGGCARAERETDDQTGATQLPHYRARLLGTASLREQRRPRNIRPLLSARPPLRI